MDSKEYLKSYGWKEGEALKKGGLRKPILVKHKKDKKGLGCAPGQDDSEAWWERLFDGHLKGLDVKLDAKEGGIKFEQKKVVASAVSKASSPLYKSFVRGEGLKGTIDKSLIINEEHIVISEVATGSKKRRMAQDECIDIDREGKKLKGSKEKRGKKDKKDKKNKKDKKGERKEKKDKRDKKREKKDKKREKKDKKSKT